MNFMSIKILGIVCTTLSLAWVPVAAHSESASKASAMQQVPLKIGEPFLQARARIIKLGWKPIRIHENDDYEYSGTEKRLVERKVFEVDGCSVDAGVLCIFYYSKMNKCLRVDTIGENVAQITVRRWAEECPETVQ